VRQEEPGSERTGCEGNSQLPLFMFHTSHCSKCPWLQGYSLHRFPHTLNPVPAPPTWSTAWLP